MLKPIDILTMVPRSLDVQKIQELNHNRSNLEQHTFAQKMTQESQQRQSQVPTSDASDAGNTIREDQSENGQRKNSKDRRSQAKKKVVESEEPVEVDSGRGHHIDFKV